MAEKRRLGELLIEAGVLDKQHLQKALVEQKHAGKPLGVTLVQLGLVDERALLAVLGQQLDFPVVQVEGRRIASEVLELVPYEVAIRHHCIPLHAESSGPGHELYLGMSDPTDFEAIADVGFRTGMRITPVLVGYSQIEDAIQRRYKRMSFTVSLAEDISLQKLGVAAQQFVEEALGAPLEDLPAEAPGPVGPLLQAVRLWRGLQR
jgi:type IV pilus assembly protein PilB